MERIALTDMDSCSDGKWFDKDKAEKFNEHTFWDGNNMISMCSGGKFRHQIMYRTKSGKWILHYWSQWQGDNESYQEIDDEEAAKWFMKNEYEDEDIPEDIFKLLADSINELEV